MVSFTELRDLNAAVFTEAADQWEQMSVSAGSIGDDLDQQVKALANWDGTAAEVATQSFTRHRGALGTAAECCWQASLLLRNAGTRIGDAQRRLFAAIDDARRAGLAVDGHGKVTDPLGNFRPQPSGMSAIQDAVSRALTDAANADGEVTTALHRWSAQSAGLAPAGGDPTVAASATPIPPRGTAPVYVKKWWDSLTDMQRESLLFTRPSEIGSLDGIPAVARDRANRSILTEQLARFETDIAYLTTKGDRRTPEETARLEANRNTFNGLRDIQHRANMFGPEREQAFILKLDTNGRGRAVVAIGNPDTAANVLTYVPGTGSKLSKVGGDLDRADKMQDAAARASAPSTSAIMWVGYDAPQDIFQARHESYADRGKQDLDRFQDGLRATHQGPPSHNVLLGHSYGTTVIGHAARDEVLAVDDLVLVASPGAGVNHAAELNIAPERVHSTVAQHDMIKTTNLDDSGFDPLGPAPYKPEFGGNVFSSDPGTAGRFYPYLTGEAHSQYWDINNGQECASLENIGRIVAGKPTY